MTAEPVAPPKFQAVPVAALPPEPQQQDKPPKRTRTPRDPNAPRVTRRARSLETQIASSLMMLNLMLWASPARNDALDDAEIAALAKAIDEQARTSPRFRKALTTALEATSGGQLVGVVVMIGARRLARHGVLLPKEADAQIGGMLGSVVAMQPFVPPATDGDGEIAGTTSDAN